MIGKKGQDVLLCRGGSVHRKLQAMEKRKIKQLDDRKKRRCFKAKVKVKQYKCDEIWDGDKQDYVLLSTECDFTFSSSPSGIYDASLCLLV